MRISVAFFALALALALWSAQASAEPSKSRLFGDGFRAESVKVGGEPVRFVKGTHLDVSFFRDRHAFVGWSSGCNGFGARARITPQHVITKAAASTAMLCDEERMEQERRFSRFFSHDPKWSFDHHRLRLQSDDTVIRLERRPHDRGARNR